MTEKDKGLKEAIRRQPAFRIPTNFTYRMMQQINEEVYRKEKQQEKRLFILMVTLCVLMVGGLCAWLIWLFKPDFQTIRFFKTPESDFLSAHDTGTPPIGVVQSLAPKKIPAAGIIIIQSIKSQKGRTRYYTGYGLSVHYLNGLNQLR